ncbi:MAG: hypothetical protein O8C66_02845 [Candidatus Methanoperedens sp.]|nr:hypothetical protein [Candidatus Methanoperedens sp.]MCZ7369424.1 hypothetical protein [Candidatus Methanoperedens sp.]
MFDVDTFKKAYPEFFSSPVTGEDIVKWFLVFILPFLLAYLYIRYFESRGSSFLRDRVVPFIRFRLRLDKAIEFIKRILRIQIFRGTRTRF